MKTKPFGWQAARERARADQLNQARNERSYSIGRAVTYTPSWDSSTGALDANLITSAIYVRVGNFINVEFRLQFPSLAAYNAALVTMTQGGGWAMQLPAPQLRYDDSFIDGGEILPLGSWSCKNVKSGSLKVEYGAVVKGGLDENWVNFRFVGLLAGASNTNILLAANHSSIQPESFGTPSTIFGGSFSYIAADTFNDIITV